MKISKTGNDSNSSKAPYKDAPKSWYMWRTLKHARRAAALILLIAGVAAAQAVTHSAKLTWTDSLNPTGTTYSVYRAPGLCSGSPVFAKIATAVAGFTYTDSSVTPGNYCYQVTAVSGGVESAPSTSVLAPVPSFAPTGLSVVVQ